MAAAARSIVRIVKPTPTGLIQRLIGTVDINGKGTMHELDGVDPVVLCDFASIAGKGVPKFGMHPHYGLIAVTAVLEGCFTDGDNLNPPEGHHNKAGGIYMVSAGKGVCHEEFSVTEGPHIVFQTIFKIPQEKLNAHPVPEVARVDASEIPDLALAGGSAKLLVGKIGATESPAKVQTLPRVAMVSINVDANSTMELPLDGELEHGYVYVVSGTAKLGGGDEWCEAGAGLYLFGSGDKLALEAGAQGAQLFLTAGKPLNEPWVKLLGKNGFIIAANNEEANKIMGVINEHDMQFSYQKL